MSYITYNTQMWKLVKKWQLVEMIEARDGKICELVSERDDALRKLKLSVSNQDAIEDRAKSAMESLDRAAMEMSRLEGELSKAQARIAEMELNGGKNE